MTVRHDCILRENRQLGKFAYDDTEGGVAIVFVVLTSLQMHYSCNCVCNWSHPALHGHPYVHNKKETALILHPLFATCLAMVNYSCLQMAFNLFNFTMDSYPILFSSAVVWRPGCRLKVKDNCSSGAHGLVARHLWISTSSRGPAITRNGFDCGQLLRHCPCIDSDNACHFKHVNLKNNQCILKYAYVNTHLLHTEYGL